MTSVRTHDDYLSLRYFGALDGLRAVSILLVVTIHTTDPLWRRAHGGVGVTVFFVISGYLITTLLLREESAHGRAHIGAFYVRRAFRILPLYYLALSAYVLLIGVLHLQPGAADLWRALPWYLTYQNDFAPEGSGFGHTWSLAVEEKFYLLWPLAFGVGAVRRYRLLAALGLTGLTALANLSEATRYGATYTPILFGCVIALILDHPGLYRHAQRLATTPVALGMLLAITIWTAIVVEDTQPGQPHVQVVFGILAGLLLPAMLIGPRWLESAMSNRVARYIGTRSYAVYLIHRMAKGVIDRILVPGVSSVPHQLMRYVLIVALSLVGAEILYRLVEQPMIKMGRRLSQTNRRNRTVPAAK